MGDPREKLRARLRGLLTLSEGGAEHESARAQILAARLLDRSGLTLRRLGEVGRRTAGPVREVFDVDVLVIKRPQRSVDVYVLGAAPEVAAAAAADRFLAEEYERVWTRRLLPTDEQDREPFYRGLMQRTHQTIVERKAARGEGPKRLPPEAVRKLLHHKERMEAAAAQEAHAQREALQEALRAWTAGRAAAPPARPAGPALDLEPGRRAAEEDYARRTAALHAGRQAASAVRTGGLLLRPSPLPLALPPHAPV